MAAIATIAIGVVFVLLIGEIDLSVAFVSAVGGVVMTLLLRPDDPGWPWWLAILVALLVTTTIGFLQALVITKAGVPSFVVTLAGLLIWSGVVLILTTQASRSERSESRTRPSSDIANDFLSETAGWILGAAAVLAYALAQLRNATRQRRASGLLGKPLSLIVLQVAGLALVMFAAVWYCNQDRGVPYAIVILIVFLDLLVVHRRANALRSPRLRGRRERRGVASGRDQRRPCAHRRLHDQRLHGRRRRHHARLAAPLGRHEHGRRPTCSCS